MCGIAGKLYFYPQKIDREKELPLISQILDRLHHRGPDSKDFFLGERVWLGATRLAIIDLSEKGNQPLVNENKSVVLVFNGEIYNYQEIKKKLQGRHHFKSATDAEVLLHLYEEKGEQSLQLLRGMFAFAIWDGKKQKLFLARDRFGKKPLKYFFNGKFFLFASELKAFLHHPEIPKEIDWEGVAEFLSYQYVPSPKTGFKGIWKLPPAYYLIVKPNGETVVQRYWKIDFSQKLNLKEEEWKELIESKLRESIKLRLQSDVSLGVHLSGGVDSGLITAFAAQASRKPIQTFSIGFKESDYNELSYARRVAQRYHTNHHELIVENDILDFLPDLVYQFEEPLADPSILPTWILMKESKKYFTVALNGNGGDENFAGYWRYQVMKYFDLGKIFFGKEIFYHLFSFLYRLFPKKGLARLAKIMKLLTNNYPSSQFFYQDLISSFDSQMKNKFYSYSFRQKIKKWTRESFLLKKFQEFKKGDWLERLLFVDLNSYLPELLLVKEDLASMAHSLEVRSPFLDQELVELIAKMPSTFKLKKFQTKYLLKKIAVDYLPSPCFQRKKQGFLPPLEYWLREKGKKFLWQNLMEKKFLSYDLFKKNFLENLVRNHFNKKEDNTYPLWTLLVLKNWLEVWFS